MLAAFVVRFVDFALLLHELPTLRVCDWQLDLHNFFPLLLMPRRRLLSIVRGNKNGFCIHMQISSM